MERRKPPITMRKLRERQINKAGRRNTLPVTAADLILTTKSHEEVDEASKQHFVLFIRSKIVCPPNSRGTLAVLLFQSLLALMVALGTPFDFPASSSTIVLLKARPAIAEFLPTLIWTAMFMLNFLYLTILIWPLPMGVPFIVILLFGQVYYVSVLARTLSPFRIIICGSYKIRGIIFVSVGSLGFALLLLVLLLAVLFASWVYMRAERGTK